MLAALLAAGVAAASCGSSPGGRATGSTSTTRPPLPAGRLPSAVSKMVCSDDARTEINDALGIKAQVQAPTWADHVYACRLLYPSAHIDLSVKELSSWTQTYGYFDTLKSRLGTTGAINGLGQGAFQAPDGSVVVRKDWKVLLVDPAGLPAQFGVPPTSSADVAVTVADVILGCWAGD